jgi:ribosomal protein S5
MNDYWLIVNDDSRGRVGNRRTKQLCGPGDVAMCIGAWVLTLIVISLTVFVTASGRVIFNITLIAPNGQGLVRFGLATDDELSLAVRIVTTHGELATFFSFV